MDRKCYRCADLIENEDAFFSVVLEEDILMDGQILVNDSDPLLLTCEECTPSRDDVVRALQQAGFPAT